MHTQHPLALYTIFDLYARYVPVPVKLCLKYAQMIAMCIFPLPHAVVDHILIM